MTGPSRKITASEVQEWADAVSVYLFDLSFAGKSANEKRLPPVLGDSTVLDTVAHQYLCACPRCMPGMTRT